MSAILTLGLLLGMHLGQSELPPNPPVPAVPFRLASFVFQRLPSFAYAGEPFAVVIETRDEVGQPYPYSGLARISTTLDQNFVYVTPTQVSFLNGRCSTYLSLTLADTLQLRCSDPGNQVTSTSAPIEVFPGLPSRFLTVMPGEELAPGSPTGRRIAPDAHIAGDTFSFDVYVTDSCFNVIRTRQDSVTFSATDNFARLPTGGRLTSGQGRFTAAIRTAGTHRLRTRAAESSPIRPDTSSPFAVLPGGYQQLLLLLPGEQLLPGDTTTSIWQTPGKSGTPTPQFLRTPFPVRVVACDRCWNRSTGLGDTITLNSNSVISFTPTTALLDDSAVLSLEFGTAGPSQTIRAVSTRTGRASYWNYIEIRARGARLFVRAPDTVRAGETTHVEVTVLDANSNPVVATRCDFQVTSGRGEILDPALLTDTLGRCQARFLCSRAVFTETDSIRIRSGTADTTIAIAVTIPDSAVMKGQVVAFPNPFGNPSGNRTSTVLTYNLPYGADVTLMIHDPFGNEVLTRRFTRNQPGALAGINQVRWDGTNNQGRRVASGIYSVLVIAQSHTGIAYRGTTRVGVVW